MKIFIIILVLFSSNILAKETSTNHFNLLLPDNFNVQTDKIRRLLAFGGNGPNDMPFLSIEFGKNIEPRQAIENINNSLKQFEKTLIEEKCSPDCKAYYVELSTSIEDIKVYRYHYLGQAKNLNFIISYGDKESLQSGREFVKDIASQILKQSI